LTNKGTNFKNFTDEIWNEGFNSRYRTLTLKTVEATPFSRDPNCLGVARFMNIVLKKQQFSKEMLCPTVNETL
jgi:hypothetical protein